MPGKMGQSVMFLLLDYEEFLDLHCPHKILKSICNSGTLGN